MGIKPRTALLHMEWGLMNNTEDCTKMIGKDLTKGFRVLSKH